MNSDSEQDEIRRVTLKGGGLTAIVLSAGAAIQDLRLDGHAPPLVLGFADPESYRENRPYFGAVAGRYANRIRDGRFSIDGETFQGPTNFMGKHSLHGGANGLAKRNWRIAEEGPDFLTLSLNNPDGAEGFPGTLSVRCTYRLQAPGTLSVEFEATTDRPTLCNLAQHSYFNLEDGGADDILGHRLTIAAGAYTPVDGELIPTGVVQPVENTEFDFRAPKVIGGMHGGEFDHNFCLASSRRALSFAARLEAPRSGFSLELWTTEPGVQFYSGGHLPVPGEGLEGRSYAKHAGLCLEPQVWPDSPNRPYFPQAILRPGETYRQLTEFRFARS
ncbi:MAG TPA: aldose epimerase family protein [Mesorhizobium sp.]|jgi:aldose 1-epimerase|nr:aldose epimerase family protein [Mesorhizobium sp.]